MNTKLPKKIYLNYCDEDSSNYEDLSGITWYSEHITVSDCVKSHEYTDLSQVWHDASEEPILNQLFLAQIGDDAFDTFIMAMDKNQDWKNWSNGINIKKWAYTDDLLPKK